MRETKAIAHHRGDSATAAATAVYTSQSAISLSAKKFSITIKRPSCRARWRLRRTRNTPGRAAARDRQALPLARGKPAAAFADHGIELLREVADELPRIRQLAHFAHAIFVRARMHDGEIVANGGVEKIGVLRDHPLIHDRSS